MSRGEMNDLREFIQKLEEEGELKRIKAEVDWDLEMGAIMRKVHDMEGPAILFEKIKGYPTQNKFFCGGLGTYSKYAIAMGLPRNTSVAEIIGEYKKRIKTPIEPKVVNRAGSPCKENILTGQEIDLFKFPTPLWHQRDGGRYIGTFHTVSIKDPDSDWVNVGMYRIMIHDKKTLGIMMMPGQHGDVFYKKYEERHQSMPIAVSIGLDPMTAVAAAGHFEALVCEWDMAGALRGKPVELVKCETVDLNVPATAEIVIEGEVPPFERKEEGIFGEYTGYYGGERKPRTIINVKCITHRNNPIHTGLFEGKPIQDNNIMSSVQNSAIIGKALKDDLKLGIREVFDHPWSAGHGVIVSMKPLYPGHVNRVAHAIWSMKIGNARDYVIAVGEDVDPTNLNEVFWALCTRCKPNRDIIPIPKDRSSSLWPCLTPDERVKGMGCKVIIDATFPAEWPEDWIPKVCDFLDFNQEIREKVNSRWKEYGF